MTTQILLRKINDHKIKKIPLPVETKPVKGGDLCSECYANIYMVAPTASGKTTAIYDMLVECADKDTKIIVFSSTLHNDPLWVYMSELFEEKKIYFEAHTSIYDEETDANILQGLVNQLRDEAKERQEEKKKKKEKKSADNPVMGVELLRLINVMNGEQDNDEEDEKQRKKRRKQRCKYVFPEYILVFDDIDDEIRTKMFASLLKRARNYKIKVIISSQALKDLIPSGRKQIRVWLLFNGISDDDLKDIYDKLRLRIPFDLFQSMYKESIVPDKDHPKPFMYIAQRDHDYRKNYDTKFIVPKQYT